MSTTFAPVTLRLSRTPEVPQVNPAVAAIKNMTLDELRSELRVRRNSSSASREAEQRESIAKSATAAAKRLRSLGR